MTRTSENLQLILLRWIPALSAGDPALVSDHLAPSVIWQGLRPDLICSDSDEVRENISRGGDLRDRVGGLELRANDDHVLIGVSLPGVTEVYGAPIEQQLFQVFFIRAKTIVRIEEYASRVEAETAMSMDVPAAPLETTADTGAEPAPTTPHAIVEPPPADAAVTALAPFVHVADLEASIGFYRALGLEVSATHHHRDRLVWACLGQGESQIMLAQASMPVAAAEQAVLFYAYSHDLDALRAHLLAIGLQPREIVDGSPGPSREMRLTDPDGYCVMVAQVEDRVVGLSP